jgi:hypothetical protein
MFFLWSGKQKAPAPSLGRMLNERIRGSTRLVFTTTLHALSGMTRSMSGDGIPQDPAAQAYSQWPALSDRGFPADVFSVIHQDYR